MLSCEAHTVSVRGGSEKVLSNSFSVRTRLLVGAGRGAGRAELGKAAAWYEGHNGAHGGGSDHDPVYDSRDRGHPCDVGQIGAARHDGQVHQSRAARAAGHCAALARRVRRGRCSVGAPMNTPPRSMHILLVQAAQAWQWRRGNEGLARGAFFAARSPARV